MVYLFVVHPDVLKKAREEVLQVLGPEGAPTAENMRSLKYGQFQRAGCWIMLLTCMFQCEP